MLFDKPSYLLWAKMFGRSVYFTVAICHAELSLLSSSYFSSLAICFEQEPHRMLSCLTIQAIWFEQQLYWQVMLSYNDQKLFDKLSHLCRTATIWQVKPPVLSSSLMASLAICFDQEPCGKHGNLLWAGVLWQAMLSVLNSSYIDKPSFLAIISSIWQA